MISNRNKLILASGRDIYISSILSLCGYLAKLNIEPNETEYFNPEYHTNIPFSNYYSKLETFWIFSFFFTLFIDLGFSEDSTYVVNTSSKNIPPSPIQLKNRCYILIIWMIWMIWKLDSGLLIFDLNTCYCIVLSCFFIKLTYQQRYLRGKAKKSCMISIYFPVKFSIELCDLLDGTVLCMTCVSWFRDTNACDVYLGMTKFRSFFFLLYQHKPKLITYYPFFTFIMDICHLFFTKIARGGCQNN